MKNWPQVALKRAAQVTYGLGQPPPLSPDGVPIIRATNIERGRIVPEGMVYAHLDEIPTERAPLLRVGEILVVRSGAYTGDSALVTADWEGAAPGYDLRVTPSPRAESRFLAYQLLCAHCLHQIDLERSRAAQPHLNAQELGEIQVFLPSVDEQRVVADFLDRETARIDGLIDSKRRVLELLDERRTATIDRATVPGLAKGSEGWALRPIRRLAAGGGLFTDGDWIEIPFMSDEGDRLIQTGNIGIGVYREQGFRYISEETFHQLRCTEVLPGDVLICRLAAPVGRACLAPDLGSRMITSVDVCILRADRSIDRQFLVFYLSSSAHLSLIDSIARGGTRDRVSREQLGQLMVPVPPIEEQRRIAEDLGSEIQSFMILSTRLAKQVQRLQERRQALITAAVTGQIEVPERAA